LSGPINRNVPVIGENHMSGHDRQLAERYEFQKSEHDPAEEVDQAGPCQSPLDRSEGRSCVSYAAADISNGLFVLDFLVGQQLQQKLVPFPVFRNVRLGQEPTKVFKVLLMDITIQGALHLRGFVLSMIDQERRSCLSNFDHRW
jgi:hypothetical protein